MIRFSNKNDELQIRRLWDMAFPEDSEFNDYFFKNIFNAENTLIMVNDGILVSMAQMIPYQLKGVGDITYIYGAATHIDYRKKGYMKTLLKASFDYDIKSGKKASILIPAEKELFDFYKKLGYENAFYMNNAVFQNTNEYSYQFRKAEYSDIENMIDIYTGDIIRNAQYFKTQIDMFRFLNGEAFVMYDNNKLISYAFVWNNDDIEIQEICGSDFNIMSNHIMKFYNKNRAKASIMGGTAPFGMAKYYTNNNYCNKTMNLMYN